MIPEVNGATGGVLMILIIVVAILLLVGMVLLGLIIEKWFDCKKEMRTEEIELERKQIEYDEKALDHAESERYDQ